MSQEWMIDILTDIRHFAAKSMMHELAEHLDDAIVIAVRELRSSACMNRQVGNDDHEDERFAGQTAEHDHA